MRLITVPVAACSAFLGAFRRRKNWLSGRRKAILFTRCAAHLVAFCGLCNMRYTPHELRMDVDSKLRFRCPACSRDLSGGVKAHIDTCPYFIR